MLHVVAFCFIYCLKKCAHRLVNNHKYHYTVTLILSILQLILGKTCPLCVIPTIIKNLITSKLYPQCSHKPSAENLSLLLSDVIVMSFD